MELPDLENYRLGFTQKGISYPLTAIPADNGGLLRSLPQPPVGRSGWPWVSESSPSAYDSRPQWPRLTIVTPSYNQGRFLEQTIRSVLLQNYPNLEYIIMDGGSTDETPQILRRYAPWISYWQSEKDGGQAQAINRGFSLASGAYHAWINSDDYYLPDVFSLVMNTFLDKMPDFIYGYGFNQEEGKQQQLVKVPPLLDYFIKIPSLIQPSCFWRSAIHQPLWEDLHCALDFELWLRLVKGNTRQRLTRPLSVANIHADAKTSDIKMKAKWHEDHLKIWSPEGHGTVKEWKKITFINKIRMKLYKLFNQV